MSQVSSISAVQNIADQNCSAWSPGLSADLPRELWHLETLYLPENTLSSFTDVTEWVGQTGITAGDLVAFKPERLVLHALIVRVTADITVLEGETEEALGINFRSIVQDILDNYIQPQMAEICQRYVLLEQEVTGQIRQLLTEALQPVEQAPPPVKRWRWPWQKKPVVRPVEKETTLERDFRIVNSFKQQGLACEEKQLRAIYRSLYQVLSAVAGRRGYLGTDLDALTNLVTRHLMNSYGSRRIGDWIDPCIEAAISAGKHQLVDKVTKPLLISLKGASAAGKSSLRPRLQDMLREKGIAPGGYATVSPDIWRRLLLDYESLGSVYKYAGRFTSNEVNVIDAKFDHYVRRQADEQASMSHLLVDRFRFDSFSSEKVSRILHDTYAKYVHTLQMYFVVTPPEATVERGWERGLLRGRYKAVEDFLGHSVEAYQGMPKIFCKWLAYDQPLFSYEFLDNSVPKGEYPAKIASGTQQKMDIYLPLGLINIQRFQKINIYATTPDEVYPDDESLRVAKNCAFLQECLRRIPQVNFIDPATETIYLVSLHGRCRVEDSAVYQQFSQDAEMAELFAQLKLN